MYPDEYVEYLVHFHADRDWFECHEILEEYWKANPGDPKARTWVALIQTAVSLYHQRRGNREGARKMMEAVLRNANNADLLSLGIDATSFRRMAEGRLQQLTDSAAGPFTDLDMPITDGGLIARCQAKCEELGLQWGTPSDLDDPGLIHKHTLRDRSDVIAARKMEAERRRADRGGWKR